MKDKFSEWLKKIQKVHPKADEEVLRFIYDFSVKQGYGEAEKVLYQQFISGYCYYFACMLKAAFNRGEVCWAAPYGHIVWVDENDIPYDISGVNKSETDDYIPEYMMGDTILDFKHIAGRVHNTSDQEIAKMVLDWQDIRSDQFGGDVTKIKTKKEAEKIFTAGISGAVAGRPDGVRQEKRISEKEIWNLKICSLSGGRLFFYLKKSSLQLQRTCFL